MRRGTEGGKRASPAGSGRGAPQLGFWLGAARRGGGACVRWRGRWCLPAPHPRAALSARREATAVGGFIGLCIGDLGGGASGSSALVSSARPTGPLGSEPSGWTCPLSMCRRRLTGAGGRGAGRGGGEWAEVRARHRGSLGRGPTLPVCRGLGPGLLPEARGLGKRELGTELLAQGE